jgi:hypothetical protein
VSNGFSGLAGQVNAQQRELGVFVFCSTKAAHPLQAKNGTVTA